MYFIVRNKLDPYNSDFNIYRRYGIYADDGSYNACIMLKGFDKPFRGRSSMIIVRSNHNNYEVLARWNESSNEYDFPGGGWNKDEDPKQTAIREAQEEVKINVTNVKYGTHRYSYSNDAQQWVKDHVKEPYWWYGYYTEEFIGTYDSQFKGKIDEGDKDSLLYTSSWYDVDYLLDDPRMFAESKQTIKKYLNIY